MSYHGIGTPGSRTLELFRNHGLTPLRRVLPPELFAQAWPHSAHPNTVLVPPVVFWLMTLAALCDGSMAAAVISFWTPMASLSPEMRQQAVSEEAFCMARRALPVHFFRALFDAFMQRQEKANAQRWLWHDKRLLGIDGTKVTLPRSKEILKTYLPPRNEHGAGKHPQALLVGLVGLWSGLCHNFVLIPQSRSEQWCACWLSRYLRIGDVLLGDRGFASYEIIARVAHRGADFLFRLPANRFHKHARRPTNSGRHDEWLVDLSLPAVLRKRCPHLPSLITVRILQYQIPGYRVSWLVTSLTDATTYSYDELTSLYHQRWNQETMHREWKHSLQLANLRSHSPAGICKEVLVQLTLNNAVRTIQAEALPAEGKPLSLSFLDSKRIVLGMIPTMAQVPVEQLLAIYNALLRKIASFTIRVRPGRYYPRPKDGKPRNKGHGELVQPARLPKNSGTPL